jgi:hypothetical protein
MYCFKASYRKGRFGEVKYANNTLFLQDPLLVNHLPLYHVEGEPYRDRRKVAIADAPNLGDDEDRSTICARTVSSLYRDYVADCMGT